ncbi:hypothetical protein [Alicyclobacillus sp. ALC3]|nr:hypothetical protein [Alicyclobacillus sp. ALC3]WDL98679.1 hypothetical protein JC200_08470 [Alicyclobacillus sp. ALC3]
MKRLATQASLIDQIQAHQVALSVENVANDRQTGSIGVNLTLTREDAAL